MDKYGKTENDPELQVCEHNKKLIIDEPLCEFKDNDQLQCYLKYWKDILLLNNWLITARLTPYNKMPYGAEGFADVNSAEQYSSILITEFDDTHRNALNPNTPERSCHELILVHELLHCFIATDVPNKNDINACRVYNEDHRLLSHLAKSFLMTKYNIDLDWFYPPTTTN